jgi:hypothetical protein
MSNIVKGYKAFNNDMTCNGFQYEVGKEYVHEGDLKICNSGFHFCENPLDVLNYYDLTNCEFTEVEAVGKIDSNKDKDSKLATDRIKIGAKLDLPAFIKASFDFLWESCNKNDKSDNYLERLASSGYNSKLASSGDNSKLASSGYNSQLASSGNNSKLASSGDYSQLASSGYNSQLASSGYNSKLASSGYNSQLASSGYNSKLASSGYNSQLASSGNNSKLASSGDYSQLASSGYNSQLASSGYNSQLASSGYNSQLEINGANSVGANIGIKGMIKGKIGCWITLAEYDDNYKIKCVSSAKIDGKKIKEDTWYKLVNKKFKEVK